MKKNRSTRQAPVKETRQKKAVRILAIILAVLLAGTAIVSAVVSMAYAEEDLPSVNEQVLEIEYMESEQALLITQRLRFFNTAASPVDRVVFYAPMNMYRRISALMYEDDELEAVFPNGYLPGGIEILSIQTDGHDTDWGLQGTDELFLRVACDIQPGESATFVFRYWVLLTANQGFAGVDNDSRRLSDFYFSPAFMDELYGDYITNTPLAFTRYIYTPAADFHAEIALPQDLEVISSGIEAISSSEGTMRRYTIDLKNAHDFSFVITRAKKKKEGTTGSGTAVRVFTRNSSGGKKVLKAALKTLSAFEQYFGTFPFEQLDIVETSCSSGFRNNSGCIWLSGKTVSSGELDHALSFSIAQQYFGMSAYFQIPSDAWLSDSLCEWLAYWIIEENDGHYAYLKALNAGVVPSLQLTIPGGLVISSDASLMTRNEYSIITLDRGAAVFHELRTAMGLDTLLEGLRVFYEKGLNTPVLTEMDLVNSLDQVSEYSWEKFLTDWVFNIGDYVNQTIDWLD